MKQTSPQVAYSPWEGAAILCIFRNILIEFLTHCGEPISRVKTFFSPVKTVKGGVAGSDKDIFVISKQYIEKKTRMIVWSQLIV